MLRGELGEAQLIAERGIRATNAAHGSAAAWRFRLLRAEVAVLQRDFGAAAPYLSAEVPPGTEFAPVRAQQLLIAAKLEVAKGQLSDARAMVSRARTVAPPDSDVALDIDALDGQIGMRLGEWNAAEATLNGVLARAQAAADHYRQAIVLNDLGMSRFVRSRYDEALPFFERVIAFDDLRDLAIYATSLSNAGICYSRLGLLDRAMTIEQRALEIQQRRGPRVPFEHTLGQLGNLHVLRGEPQASLPYFEQALRVANDANAPEDAELWAGNLATAYTDLRRWDDAERYNAEARRLWTATHAGQPAYHTLTSAAIAAGRGRYADAATLYEEALGASGAPPSVSWDAHFGLATVAISAGDRARAAREFEAALGVIEHTRAGLLKTDYKVSYLTQLIAFYQAYVQMLVDDGDVARALEIADSSRGRVLAERQRTAAPSRATAAQFRKTAGASHTVLLSYWLAPQQSYVWAVTGDAVRGVPLPPAKDIETLVRAHQTAIANAVGDTLAGTDTAGQQLYHALIAPIARWIPPDAKIVIVPDGALHGINFETLPVDGPRRHYWIEDVEIEIAPSLGSLTPVAAADRRTPSLLLIGNADPHPPEFPPLRYAAAEMTSIAQHFAGARVAEYDAQRASPAAYREADPARFEYVHFTAHAATSADSPLDSAVILSGPQHAYKLYARDVADLPLNADLVTVSACRSAGERAFAGEGLVGFSWAFLRAGARRVIAGLWDVDDRSTADLMDALYGNLVGGDRPSRALRRAKLAMIARGGSSASPYRWAPFELFTVVP